MKFKPTACQGDTTFLVDLYLFICLRENFFFIPCPLEVLYLVRETRCYSCYHEVSTGEIY